MNFLTLKTFPKKICISSKDGSVSQFDPDHIYKYKDSLPLRGGRLSGLQPLQIIKYNN